MLKLGTVLSPQNVSYRRQGGAAKRVDKQK
jgi:hypothetical protein